VVLHQRRRQRVLERRAVLERDVLHRLHRVEVLGQAHGEARLTQLHDEPVQELEHGRARDLGLRGGEVGHRRPQALSVDSGPPRFRPWPSLANSLTALAMSVWYLRRMFAVEVATS